MRAGLRLGQADHADLGLGEHRGRHVRVVDLRRLAAEHGVGEGMAFADRNRRQSDAVGDVADRIDVRHRRLREFVDRDRAFLVELDAGGFEPEPFTFGRRPVANITLSTTTSS